MKKKIPLCVGILIVINIILVILFFSSEEMINRLVFRSYITGRISEEKISPFYVFNSEQEIMNTGEGEWKRLLSGNPNTQGFIDGFYSADMYMEPRMESRGAKEQICVVVPKKDDSYQNTIDDFIEQNRKRYPVSDEELRIGNDYCGGNEYYEQQRVRYLIKYTDFFSSKSHMDAYRVLVLKNFIKNGDQIIYLGEMTAEEVRKNFDLLMNEYLNSWKTGVFRDIAENDEYYYYNFYTYVLEDQGDHISYAIIIIKDTYQIDKKNGIIHISTMDFRAEEEGTFVN